MRCHKYSRSFGSIDRFDRWAVWRVLASLLPQTALPQASPAARQPGLSIRSLLSFACMSPVQSIIFIRPGLVVVVEFSAALRVRFPFRVPRDGAQGRRACCATSTSDDPALAHAARRTREVAAAAAAAAAATTDGARCDVRTRVMSRYTARSISSCASFPPVLNQGKGAARLRAAPARARQGRLSINTPMCRQTAVHLG